MSDAVKYFLRASLKYNYLPPGIEEANFNEETLAAMREADDIMNGKVQTKVYNSFDELLAEIDAEIAMEDKANAET